MDNFKNLVKKLREVGYVVDISHTFKKDKNMQLTKDLFYYNAYISGNNIRGGFCSQHDSSLEGASLPSLNGKIAVDHVKCFDKYSKCPLILTIPENEAQMNYLIKELEIWGSEEGFNISNEYDHSRWTSQYPDIAQEKWNYAIAPKFFMCLIGKKVIQENRKTKEKWEPQTLLKVEITKDGVFAVLNEDFNIMVDLSEFDIYESK